MSRFGLFLILLFSLGSAFSQVPSYVPTNGLVGWWPFNGNANDESGNGNNGTVNGATLTNDRYGNTGKAFSFDGVTNYITIGSFITSPISNSSITISAWVNTIANNQDAMSIVVCRGNGPTGFYIQPGNSLTLTGTFADAGGGFHNADAAPSVKDGVWHHLLMTYNGNVKRVYCNGQIVAEAIESFNLLVNGLLEFGRDNPYSRYFNGKLDDIGIWNRVLTQQEITNLYNSTSPFDISASANPVCAGEPVTLTVNSLPGTISTLTCASATNNGTLIAGVAASGVNSLVPYSGGNGGLHNGQTVTSTGVTGLTATLTAGTFASGNGSITYTITGTPSASGTASFALNIGGQTCTLTRTVNLPVGTIATLSCGTTTNTGTLTVGTAASGVNSSVPYTGGNGGTHNGQTVTSTGVAGLTATLAAGTFAVGAGNLNYTITGTPSASGTASFALNIGGQTCTLTRTVNLPVGTIATLSCGTATNTGTLTAYTAASGVSSSIPYTGGNGGGHVGQTVTSTGVTGLTATLAPGSFAYGWGNLTYTITGTPSTSGTASFALNIGGQTCVLSRTVNLPVGTISALNCGSATITGTLESGTTANGNGVSVTVPYTGGNGGTYNRQEVTSTGVTGLRAKMDAGMFVVGAGNLTYTITDMPSSSGTASFLLNIGGQMCTLNLSVASNLAAQYPSGSVFCSSGPTIVSDVTNPTTGKTWMDRNLGATRAATSSTDAQAYGDLYQWGRRSDGHQCRNSATTTTLSSTDQPSHGSFILTNVSPNDWRNPQNNNLWQGVSGTNNPCPSGYRIPTELELESERLSWSENTSVGAFASILNPNYALE